MNPKESKWTAKVVKEAREIGTLVFAIVGSEMQEPGWPDRHFTHRRWSGFLEFKGKVTRVKPKQAIIIRELNRRKPGSAYIVRWPGLVQDHDGNTLGEFDGTGRDLIDLLEMLNARSST